MNIETLWGKSTPARLFMITLLIPTLATCQMDHDQLICMHSKSKANLNKFYPSKILSNFLHYIFKFLMKTSA